MPPIPPHATFDQMKSTAEAVLKGDEDAVGLVKTGLKTKVQEFLPHRRG
jgi:pyruvate dehydrogenase (quinone)